MRSWGKEASAEYKRLAMEATKREPDFCVPTFVLESGRVTYRLSPHADKQPWRYNLAGARHVIARIKRDNFLGFRRHGEHETVKARPNCIVRVYLK